MIWRYDAVHGYVDIRDAAGEGGTIIKLLNSSVLQRLRRIKQLGFASESYPAADHSRYAHALGTMHMMRMLLKRLSAVNGLSSQLFHDLNVCFPGFFTGDLAAGSSSLLQHMLVAALLQDLGELPYNQAAIRVFKPSHELRLSVENVLGFPITRWADKEVFTIGCLHSNEVSRILRDLSLPFLVFLITGHARAEDDLPRSLMQLRNMMDGVVDADRLDYVFRDAYHTLGGLGTPASVIDSLLYYDESGPVFSDPGPVSNFLATRAYMYSAVYFAPASRFRVLALVNFLKGLVQREDTAREFYGTSSGAELSIEDFLELDDVLLTARIAAFATSPLKRRLDQRTRNALDILTGGGSEYQCLWLPPGAGLIEPPKGTRLPDDLFFDTYANESRPLYEADSVRIAASRFQQFGRVISLGECGGPFGALFRGDHSILPMPGSILVFAPYERKGEVWKDFEQGLVEGWLYKKLIENDPLSPIDFPTDTRLVEGFIGPSLFISFSWADIATVRKIASVLYKKHRHYYLFSGPYQGIGSTASMNSIEAVKQADVVLICASSSYAQRYRDAPDGYIAKEIFEMSRRVAAKDGLRVMVLGVDELGDIARSLPWSQLGFDEVPFVGGPLKCASDRDFEDAVQACLQVIDR
jgi:HD superfamily phosphohydrolase